VDAYDDPNFVNSTDPNFANSDLHRFDAAFGLPDPPSFTKVKLSNPGTNSGWIGEIALDVEWAHAIAPGANIVLVEGNSASTSTLLNAADYARNLAGVSVVSMSFGGSESSFDTGDNSTYTTPSGHQGITFIAS